MLPHARLMHPWCPTVKCHPDTGMGSCRGGVATSQTTATPPLPAPCGPACYAAICVPQAEPALLTHCHPASVDRRGAFAAACSNRAAFSESITPSAAAHTYWASSQCVSIHVLNRKAPVAARSTILTRADHCADPHTTAQTQGRPALSHMHRMSVIYEAQMQTKANPVS